jgi:hypothetical protein
MLDANHSV